MPECVGDVFGLDIIPFLLRRVVVTTYRCIWWGPVLEVAVADSAEGFGPTDEFVVGASVSDLFSLDGILLVIEREVGVSDQLDVVQVMQRCTRSGVGRTSDNERYMAEEEGFGAALSGRARLSPVYSAGRMSQKKATMQRSMIWTCMAPSWTCSTWSSVAMVLRIDKR